MTLANGDRIFFDVGTDKLRLQFVAKKPGQTGKEPIGWDDGDTVIMNGSEVALFLLRLEVMNQSGEVVGPEARGTSHLYVTKTYDDMGRISATLTGNTCSVKLKGYERDMFVDAIRAILWRLFV